MIAPVPRPEIDRFYRAAALGLGLLERRSGAARRFGPDADARWSAFRGGLSDWDRLDLLVRDAAVRHPAGFAPRVVFALPGLAEDEPCGPDWPGPAPTEAAALLRTAASVPNALLPAEVASALDAVAADWGLLPRPLGPAAVTGIEPATRLLLAGAGAVISVAAAFAGRAELDLGDQAVLVADDPGTRQLFGLALAVLGSVRPARIVRFDASADDLRAAGIAVDRCLVSDDLPPDRAAAARALGG